MALNKFFLKKPKKETDILGSYADNTYHKLNVEQTDHNFNNSTELINTDNIFDNTFQVIELETHPEPIIQQRETIEIPIIPRPKKISAEPDNK